MGGVVGLKTIVERRFGNTTSGRLGWILVTIRPGIAVGVARLVEVHNRIVNSARKRQRG